MKQKLLASLIFTLASLISSGQTDTSNIPKPPTEKLKVLEPYFGNYALTGNYGNLKWSGTMEVKPIIKGWYVEWIILVKSEANKIDREFHMMITWDDQINKYRVWWFQTTPQFPELDLKIEGSDIIVEAKYKTPDGETRINYNRYSMPNKDQIKTVTEIHSVDGKKIKDIGVSFANRIKQ
jgi:hypothetical protein